MDPVRRWAHWERGCRKRSAFECHAIFNFHDSFTHSLHIISVVKKKKKIGLGCTADRVTSINRLTEVGGSPGDNTPASFTREDKRSKNTTGSKEQILSCVPLPFISRSGGGGVEWFPQTCQWKEACFHTATDLLTAGVSQIQLQASFCFLNPTRPSTLPSWWYYGAHSTAYQLWNKRLIRSST